MSLRGTVAAEETASVKPAARGWAGLRGCSKETVTNTPKGTAKTGQRGAREARAEARGSNALHPGRGRGAATCRLP